MQQSEQWLVRKVEWWVAFAYFFAYASLRFPSVAHEYRLVFAQKREHFEKVLLGAAAFQKNIGVEGVTVSTWDKWLPALPGWVSLPSGPAAEAAELFCPHACGGLTPPAVQLSSLLQLAKPWSWAVMMFSLVHRQVGKNDNGEWFFS